jgi:uncharacterized protein
MLWLAVAGVTAGAASGLLGIGGGVVMVPVLVAVAGLGFREAVAVSLLVMTLTGLVGVWRHAKAGNVRPRVGVLLGVAGFAGVLAGAWVGPRISESDLMRLFALVLVLSARHLAYGGISRVGGSTARIELPLGFAAGLIAKLFGIGGGIVMVPGLVFSGMAMHQAVGTSLVAVWTNAALSTGLNLWMQPPAFLLAVPLALGSFVGLMAGSWAALRSHAVALKRGFSLLMILVSIDLVRRSFL